jgi:hypothetical protein
MVTQMKIILDQYAAKIKYLEVENAVLREEVRKAGIQIPLSAFSAGATTTGSTVAPSQTSNSGNTTTQSGSQITTTT